MSIRIITLTKAALCLGAAPPEPARLGLAGWSASPPHLSSTTTIAANTATAFSMHFVSSLHRETNAIKYVHEHEHIHALALLTQRLAAFSQTGEWRQQLCVDTHLTVINYHPNTVTGRQRREEAPRSFTASLTEPKGLFASCHSSRLMDQSLNK